MCGIVGLLSRSNQYPLTKELIISMRDRMVPRGPDDAGIYLYKDEALQIGLGHRRLSIIDLSDLGQQPMSTHDGKLWIVFNGEIFNYQELRKQLIDKYQFKSNSDTEVILYAVREWGLDGCLQRLRGMYAFALFDQLDSSLTLVRDPLGVKPLYYYIDNNIVAFASEIKALGINSYIKTTINQTALSHYLTFANAPAPNTFFSGIHKLEAGNYLKIDSKGNSKQIRFWNSTRYGEPDNNLDEATCIEQLRDLLRQSVARRMVSDVPFGVFLSGGVDSSLNTALMAEQLDHPVETFSIGIKGDSSNEFEYARKVAQHFKTNHHEMIINDDDFISALPKIAYFQDEPLADPVCVPIYYISKLARDSGVPVIQVGEGSDEIFAGYGMYHQFNKWNTNWYAQYLHIPKIIKTILYQLASGRIASHLDDALRRAMQNETLFMGNAIAFWDNEKTQLFKQTPEIETSSKYINQITKDLNITDSLLRIINLELKNRLPELLLMRVDKMSMAHSIETRVPFLDEDLVEFALKIPSALKFKNGETKYILKKAAEGIIPMDIIYRKKWGFCGSATNMLTDKIISYAYDNIMSSKLTTDMFNKQYIEKIFKQHKKQSRFNSFKIWNLLNLILWYEQYEN
jgi:asparagine synthase (glutamine-hydrolysing)